jgi:hypothetical protein
MPDPGCERFFRPRPVEALGGTYRARYFQEGGQAGVAAPASFDKVPSSSARLEDSLIVSELLEEGADVAAAKRLGLPLVMATDDLDVRLGHPSFGLHSRTGKV